jgi:cobalt/nickel transport system ATP-binding protein
MNLHLEREEIADRISASLIQMNLDGYQKRAPQYLSGGEKKRVSIADILAMKPEMILFDEPTASLDPENVVLLEETLNDLSRAGITLVISTHDVDFAYRFAKRVIVFHQGEIIADADIESIFADVDVLAKTGLKKPSIYAAAELLGKQFPNADFEPRPRDIGEFETFINGLK